MNNLTENTTETGLVRYAAVCQIQQIVEEGVSLTRALALCAQKPWGGRSYGKSTLEKWYYRYRHEGYEGLKSLPRSDKGQSKALSGAFKEALRDLRVEKPQLNITSALRELERRGVVEPHSYSLSSVYRFIHENGLNARRLKQAGPALGGPAKAFEMGRVNELWMSDAMVGVCLKNDAGKAVRTSLMAIIDDHSRLLLHAQYYPGEKAWCFIDTLKKAIRRRGVPEKLYTDNGKVFTTVHLQQVCANLGIRLTQAKPYHAWSKGKIERFFLTVQRDFEQRLHFERAGSIEELNERFWQWVEKDYNQKVHSSLKGQSPADRFLGQSGQLRFVENENELEGLFMKQVTRTVRKDCTISIEGTLWEVPLHLRSEKVQARFDPFAIEKVVIFQGERRVCLARPCNKTVNAHHFGSYNYEK